MSESRFSGWAGRHIGRGGHTPQDPVERAQPQMPAPAAAPALPPAPPGYAWGFNQQHGFLLVPLQPQAQPVPVAPPAPPRQPGGVVPYIHQQPAYTVPQPGRPPAKVLPFAAPVRSCQLVKQGDRDTFAELMSTIPDLVPPTEYDAMAGNINPITAQELAGIPEFQMTMGSPDAPVAFPTQGRGVPVAYAGELRAVAGAAPPPAPAGDPNAAPASEGAA